MIDVVQALAGDLAPGTTVSVCETGASMTLAAPPVPVGTPAASYPAWVPTSLPFETPILVSGSTVFPVWYSTKPLAFT
jgi:hypothetical protein